MTWSTVVGVNIINFRSATHTHAHTHTHIDKGPETGGFSRVLGVVGIISIFMY